MYVCIKLQNAVTQIWIKISFRSGQESSGQKTEEPDSRVLLCISGSEWENFCSNRKLIRTRTKYIYINLEYRYILEWFRKSDIPTKLPPDSLYLLITYGICKETKYYFSTFFYLHYWIPNTTEHRKNRCRKNFDILRFIVSARYFLRCWWHGIFYCSHNIF